MIDYNIAVKSAYARMAEKSITKLPPDESIGLHHSGLVALERIFRKAEKRGLEKIKTPFGERPVSEDGFVSLAGLAMNENRVNALNNLPLTRREELVTYPPKEVLIRIRKSA